MPMKLFPVMIWACIAIPALNLTTAMASENSAGVVIPAPVGHVSEAMSIDKVAVSVNDLDAAIRYAIRNNSKKATSTTLSIYGPLFGWEGTDSSYPDKAFVELQISVDQKPIKAIRNVVALFEGELVNSKLSRLHLDPLWMARKPDTPIETAPKVKLRSAIHEGLIKDLGQGLVPNWYALASHTWSASTPPRSQQQIALSYHLRPAYEPFQLDDARLNRLLVEHCTNATQVREQIKVLGRKVPESVVALQYAIPIGFGDARTPSSVSLEVKQEKAWGGLHPFLSFSCKSNGEAAIGLPSFSQEVSSGIGQVVSILILLPQE